MRTAGHRLGYGNGGGAAPRVDRLGGTNRGHGPGAQTGDAEGLDQRYRLGAQAWGRGPGT